MVVVDAYGEEILSFKVLVAKYNLEDSKIRGGGIRTFVWWRHIISVKEGVGLNVGRWFKDNLKRNVSNGDILLFGGQDV
jgi:hypothetical protein